MKKKWHYFIPFISNKFRVRQVMMCDDSSKYFPQYRIFLIWRNIKDESYGVTGDAWYSCLSEAEEYLYKLTMEKRANTIKKRTSHPFDAVFHKLKKTKNHEPLDECDEV